MPARQFLDGFAFDPATFNWDQFKSALSTELATDDDLATAKITGLTEERDTLTRSERDLKVSLFDATVKRQGPPVTPTDSPSTGDDTVTAVPENAVFGAPTDFRSR